MNSTEPTETKEIVLALNSCIETCTDGEKGYALAAADVRTPDLKDLFMQRSKERAAFVHALQEATEKLHAFAENQGSMKGTLHRGWVGLRKVLEGQNDQLILEEVKRGEQAAFTAYQEALCHALRGTLPSGLQSMLQEQFMAIEKSLEDLRSRKVVLQ